MTQKPHILIAALFSSMLLVACDSGAIEDASSNLELPETTEIALPEEVAEETELVSEETSADDSSAEVDTNTTEATTEEMTTLAETEEALAEAIEQEQTIEEMDPVLRIALGELIEATELDKEAYTYTFEQTAEYIQVEVREKNEDVAPLEGIYRYMIDTGEILYSDYLTGDFVPFP